MGAKGDKREVAKLCILRGALERVFDIDVLVCMYGEI